MRFNGTVPLPASPEAIWPHLTNPQILAACFPGVKSWQPLAQPNQFALQISHHAFPQARGIPPVTITWDSQTPPTQLCTTAVIPLNANPFRTQAVLDLHPSSPNQTNLAFTVTVDTQSKMIEKLTRQFAPQIVDTFFKNFIRRL